ncbi:MAG: zinc ribbon domain-containing protein [Burkholderiaceae bacterium]|jgi:putative FmdB family regulatory protein|tara:strand:+ start:3334 stop:3723 length:390 start_codon:yes stop_codon:yes gene_type:complete
MPIYAYKCAACGFAKDVLRKMSDPALTQCLSCGAEAFEKQVTAAGFQLKGSGWYVTDFRDGGKSGSADKQSVEGGAESAASDAGPSAASEGTPATKPASEIVAPAKEVKPAAPAAVKPASSTPAPSSAS